ncbi:ArnT family glycosyltransferase [Chitinophaga defluvii]|uniref:Glycosyltransferase family 39 protein n=1 Tax=Chitinophaga defluvii TaxID=3163343 RepID=A0ABV2T8L7_9BACT
MLSKRAYFSAKKLFAAITEKQLCILLLIMVVLLQFSALPVTILEPDGALYAGIAKSMVQRHDYWNLIADGHDWLDKPHFPFWMMCISFNLFGFTTWAYKLPAILFLLMGAWYTYKFAAALYDERVARWAVCILLTAEHLVISNNDVRAEPYLTGLIIASVYHFYRSRAYWFSYHLLLGAVLAACAIMTKGLFALVPIAGAIGGHLLLQKEWRQVLHPRWLLAVLFILIFILPELYALYLQFDQHPEKVVFGRTGVSGIRFFFWDSQFGRFMNTGPIKGEGDLFFFFHTLLWAFLPWSILLYAALIAFIRKGRTAQEYYCISGALLTFALFSLSKFQLPHYLNIIFPFFAILTAQYILSLHTPKGIKFYRITQYTIIILLAIGVIVIDLLYKPVMDYAWLLLAGLVIAVYMLTARLGRKSISGIFYRTCLAGILLNLYLNMILYPDMMQYQSGSEAARYANHAVPHMPVVFYGTNSYALEFYLDAGVMRYDSTALAGVISGTPLLLFTGPAQMADLEKSGYKCVVLKSFPHFYISKLDLPFVRKATRESALEKRLLITVQSGETFLAQQR